jgi:hypothetical protein
MALQEMRWATCLPGASLAHQKRATLMTKRDDHHHRRGSIGTWRAHRRARLCQYRLTGHLLPAHESPSNSCCTYHPPKAHAPLALGIEGHSLPQRLCISPPPSREELHLHTDQVIKDLMISAPYPPQCANTVVSGKRIAQFLFVRPSLG